MEMKNIRKKKFFFFEYKALQRDKICRKCTHSQNRKLKLIYAAECIFAPKKID
jgi:hypothetical protein